MDFLVSLLTTLITLFIYLNTNRISNERNRLVVRGIIILIGIITAFASITRLLVIVPPGNVGVQNFFGKVSDTTLNPGLHVLNPFTKVLNLPTRLKDVKENLDATSQEGLSLNIDVSVQYKLDPQKAPTVYKNIGIDETQLVTSRFRSIIRTIVSKYPAVEIYSSKREEIARQIDEQLNKEISPLGFVVDQALLRNVKMPDSIQAEIQEKLKAEQQNQRMKFVLENERQEAERKRIEAKGIADSQKTISQSITSQTLQLRAIEANEKLAQSQNSKIIVLGGEKGNIPILIQPDASNQKP
jgi:regulator of protease activity HflC (stomatin/prohibitin superfamily)